jgi:hypothetical protein
MVIVYMIQTMPHTWCIKSKDGHTIVKSIRIDSLVEAEDYIKKFCSSFSDWGYELRPL